MKFSLFRFLVIFRAKRASYVSNEVIFHFRNSHRQSTRKRWQNRSRRNWAQMASSANNAMQKGKNFKHHQELFWLSAWSNQVFKGLLRSLFSHRFLLIMQKKRTTTVDSQTQFDILRIEFRLTLNLGEIGKVAKKSVDPYK